MKLFEAIVFYIKKKYKVNLLKDNVNDLKTLEDELTKLNYKIESYTISKELHTESLPKYLPKTFISSLNNNGQENYGIVVFKKSYVSFRTTTAVKFTIEDFFKNWTGKILDISEKNPKSNNKTNFNNSEKLELIIYTVLLFLAIATSQHLFFVILINGISFWLLRNIITQESGLEYQHKILNCSDDLENNCSELKNYYLSKKLNFTIADLGFIFFETQIILIIVIGLQQVANSNLLNVLFYLYVLSIPLIIFSLGYQIYQNKFCKVCISIIILLLLNTSFLFYYFDFQSFFWNEYVLLSILFALSISLLNLSLLKLNFKNKSQLLNISRENLNLLRSTDIKSNYYLSVNKIYEISEFFKDAYINNPVNFKCDLILVASLNCPFCEKISGWVENALTLHSTELRFKILFRAKDDLELEVSGRIMEIISIDPTKGFNAYKDWYKLKNYYKWFDKYGKLEDKHIEKKISQLKYFLDTQKIEVTPTLLVNKHILRNVYSEKLFHFFLENFLI